MTLSKFLSAGALALALSAGAGAADASVSVGGGATYDLDLKFAVSDIIVFNYATPFNDFNQGFQTAPVGTSSLTVNYLTPAQLGGAHFDVSAVFLLGVTSNLPGDPPGQQHLVVFTNNAFAAAAKGIAFGTLFPNTNETALISDLENEDNPGDIFNFAGGDAISGKGSVASITFKPGNSFTAVAFSTGQIIGTGASSSFGTAVPEPGTWAMLIVGVGLVGAMSRQRKRARVGA